MAIPLGKPVEEIARGVESMKIGGNGKVSENAGKSQSQKGTALPSADGVTVQAHRLGHGLPGGEMVAQTPSAEVSNMGTGIVVPSRSGHLLVENSAMVQHHSQDVEPLISESEQFPQHPYAGMASVPLQGPIQTCYPAPYMDPLNYYSYYVGGDLYNSPIASVYNQNYFYTVPGVDPYVIPYSGQYGYPQYQVAPVEHYDATPNSLPLSEDGVMAPELPLSGPAVLAPYGYPQPADPQLEHGQWVPMPMYTPTLMSESLPNYNLVSYPVACYPDVLNVQPAACIPQPDGRKSSNEVDESSCDSQLPRLKGDHVHSKGITASSEGIDVKALTVENKRAVKKQLSLFYGPPLPRSWVRSGQMHCWSAGTPLKSFNAKIKSSGMRAATTEPFARADVNLDNFSLDYEEAKHFVIKSFSEENVVRSIQYGVWASTANGNKKLDEAFKDAQSRSDGKPKKCPVFLYFSVNGSGRFCGVAEMVGAVDYNTTMNFWERNRWCGSFPVKWHFIKDVPHSQLRKIVLHNNENKPVTSSRDTQEVNFEQGMQMLSIISNYSTKASILDIVLPLQRESLAESLMEQSSGLDVRLEGNDVAEKDMHPEAIGEQEECQTPSTMETNSALKVLNGDVEAGDAQLAGKQNVDASNQGMVEESGGGSVDKENVAVMSLGAATPAA